MKIIFVFYFCVACGFVTFGQKNEKGGQQEEVMTVSLDIDHVMDAYIAAIGGKEKVNAIKDMTIIRESKSEGKKNERIVRQINAPGGTFFVMQGYVDGKETYKTIIEKNKIVASFGSSKQIIEGEKAEEIYNQTFLFIEPAYAQIGVKPELEGVEKVNGKYAYKVKANFGNVVIFSFYDCQSGLKVEVAIPGRQGLQVSYIEDYRETDSGVLYAYGTRNGDNVNTITKIETNQGLKMEDFQ